jgi:transposase
MIDNAAKDKIVALRAQGWSYERISKELGISPSTAYDWGAKLKNEIDKLRAIQLEAIQERVFGDYEQELTYIAEELKRVQAELRDRDYGYVNTEQLYWYQGALLSTIARKRAALQTPVADPQTSESNKTE